MLLLLISAFPFDSLTTRRPAEVKVGGEAAAAAAAVAAAAAAAAAAAETSSNCFLSVHMFNFAFTPRGECVRLSLSM